MEIFSPQLQLEIKFLGFRFVPPRHSGQLLNWKWAAVEMKEIFWLLSEARRMPLPSLLCVFGLTSTWDQTFHALSLIAAHHWMRYIIGGARFQNNFQTSAVAVLKYSKCASTFQSGLGKVSIDVPSSRSNPFLWYFKFDFSRKVGNTDSLV